MENVVYYDQLHQHSSESITQQLNSVKLIYRNNIRDVMARSEGRYLAFSPQAGSLDRLLEAIPIGDKYELVSITGTPCHKHEFLLQVQIRIRVNSATYHYVMVKVGICLDFSIMDLTPYTVDTFERAVPFTLSDSAKELLTFLRTVPHFDKTTSAEGYYKTPEGYCYHIVPFAVSNTV